MTASEAAPGQVLVVDDDPVSRTLFKNILARKGFVVMTADGGVAARDRLVEHGLRSIDCVLTDYRMPELDGLDLLGWLSRTAGSPAVVMVSGEGVKETVTESLRGGACDFLEKPIDAGQLAAAVARAVERARYERSCADLATAAVRIAAAQDSSLKGPLGANVRSYHQACHAAGGDSLCGFRLGGGRRLYLLSDVSGHDLEAAFTSAYFQGIVRGMTERKAAVPEILRLFNRLLLDEWHGHDVSSISLCAIEIDDARREVTVYRCGSPLVVYSDGAGRARSVAFGRAHPLGWFEEAEPVAETVAGLSVGSFYSWTDGLEDVAEERGVSPLGLAALLAERGDGAGWLTHSRDDVLAARIDLGEAGPEGSLFRPLLAEMYAPGQTGAIDVMQERWARTLRMAAPELAADFLQDVLLCCREAVLNALEHGCRPGDFARLVLSHAPRQGTIRARVEDPGQGHENGGRAAETALDSEEGGRGLTLIRRLCDCHEVARRGAELTMDWNVGPRLAPVPKGREDSRP